MSGGTLILPMLEIQPQPRVIQSEIAVAPEVDQLLRAGAPVAIGVSGGKDSCALALALNEHLDRIEHAGPRILIHSDLGRTEWRDSLPTCERLAVATGLELVVVRRQAGDMLARWQTRWANNVSRYVNLSCVRLILPWSTPSMRFCTSEMKVAVICSDLVKRFPGRQIVSACGIRAEESDKRAQAPIAKAQKRLTNRTHATSGWDWHPILGWTLADVLAFCRHRGFRLHEAYDRYGCSRVSCCFCILSRIADLVAAASCSDNHGLYREMVALEVMSAFSFQDRLWLGDVAPHLLPSHLLDGLKRAKGIAARREAIEVKIPTHLLYTAGWPTCMPTRQEANLLATVRRDLGDLMGFEMRFTTAPEVIGRYEELMVMKTLREGRKAGAA